MHMVFLFIYGGLFFSFPSHADVLNTPRTKGDRAMEIDSFPLPSETDPFLTPPSEDSEHELPAPLEETFKLHSNPGASKVIYLDFNGHTIMWQGSEFYYVPWNREGTPNTFSVIERTIIQLTWQSVAEDFKPFDLDVTTEEPDIEALMNTGGDDEEWGIRAVINHSTDTYSWAYTDSFNDSEDTEMFAWTGNFSSINETWIWTADSISHEAGHALGLGHDGTTDDPGGYYVGHGTGAISWSPIMGWTNYGLSQWSQGEYTDADNQEDDLSILTTQNGFGFRTDDHGSTIETATPVDIYTSSLSEGIIEQREDIDFFAFTITGNGVLQMAIGPDNLAPNLDIEAKLYDSEGTILHSSNPPIELKAEFEVPLVAGDYYLSVDGTGYDDPDSDGYSDYGSLGYYKVEVSVEADPVEPGDTADSGGSGDTAGSGTVEDSGAVEEGEALGPKGDASESLDAGGCGCSSGNQPWSISLLLFSISLFIIRRRETAVS